LRSKTTTPGLEREIQVRGNSVDGRANEVRRGRVLRIKDRRVGSSQEKKEMTEGRIHQGKWETNSSCSLQEEEPHKRGGTSSHQLGTLF